MKYFSIFSSSSSYQTYVFGQGSCVKASRYARINVVELAQYILSVPYNMEQNEQLT